MTTGARLQLLQLLFSGRIGRGTQLLQQILHGGDVVGHLAGEAQFCPMAIAKALGLFPAKSKDVLDQRGIVQFALAGSAHMGPVNGLS